MAALVAIVAVFLAGVGPAGAQGEAPPADGQSGSPIVHSWALSPTVAADAPARTFFTYDLAPGSEITDSATLWNYSNVQMTFRVYATDALNNSDGGFDLIAPEAKPKDAGAWITLPQQHVTVPPNTSIDLPITLRVPPNATPGDHAAGIVAESKTEGTGPDGATVALNRRTGSRLYLRVSGDLKPALAITDARGVYHAKRNFRKGSLDITYTVRNRGNVRLGATQTVVLKNVLGRVIERRTVEAIDELLPGNKRMFTVTFDKVPATGRLSAEIILEPTNITGGDELPAVRKRVTIWAIPWMLLPVSVVIALCAAGVRRWRNGRGKRAGKAHRSGERGHSRLGPRERAGGLTGPVADPTVR